MKILIGCEESGIVRDAFKARGHDAWSCDILPSLRGGAHLQCDVLDVLERGWDMAIFFPLCKYLSASGLHWNRRTVGRAAKTRDALVFVEKLWDAPIEKIAIENPQGCLSTFSNLMAPSQSIQPYEFEEDASKETCLWLKGLPPLIIDPAKRVAGRMVEWPRGSGKIVERWANQTDSGQNKLPPSECRAAIRGYTYPGVAIAFAENWG